MSDLYWLNDGQMDCLRRYVPKSRDKPRIDDRRVMSGIVFVNRNRLREWNSPSDSGPTRRRTTGESDWAIWACPLA